MMRLSTSKRQNLQMLSFGLVFIVGAQVATQFIARSLKFSPSLGSPFAILGETLIYPFYKFFSWSSEFQHTYPQAINEASLYFGITVLVGAGVVAALRLLDDKSLNRGADTYGSARFGTGRELKEAGLLGGGGIVLGQFNKGKEVVTYSGEGHVLITAPTRSGKTVGPVIGTALTYPHSVIFYDLKGELWDATAGFRAQFSYPIYFNPFNEKSARFNPLREVPHGINEVKEVRNIVSDLVAPGEGEKEDHWIRAARTLIEGLVLHVLYSEKDKTLGQVAKLLFDPTQTPEQLFALMLSTPHMEGGGVHIEVAQVARAMLDMAPNEQSGVVSTARQHLSIYRDPVVAQSVSESDFALEDLQFGKHPVSLYFCVNTDGMAAISPLFRVILNQLLRRISSDFKRTKKEGRALLMMLDEFPQLGKMAFVEQGLAYLAGYNVQVVAITQSEGQLKRIYGQHHTISDNMLVRLHYATQEEREAEALSRALGTTTRVISTKSKTKKKGVFDTTGSRPSTENEQHISRRLLTADEIMCLDQNKAILRAVNQRAFLIEKLRYFEHPVLRERIIPPPPLEDRNKGAYRFRPKLRDCYWDSLQYIDFDEMRAILREMDEKKSDDSPEKQREHVDEEVVERVNPQYVSVDVP
ncbi:MAG: type IV secretory system conjugative DNA transfer family protein, partial [Bdellovibrionales bacterium]|nr:type IV secretory system conjugative DNA transfer family protein [Bdellovibrionales bacterium]